MENEYALQNDQSGITRIMVASDGQRLEAQHILTLSAAKKKIGQDIPSSTELWLTVRSSVQAHIRCFCQTAGQGIYKLGILPGAAERAFSPGQALTIPVAAEMPVSDTEREQITAILCLATGENLDAKLPKFMNSDASDKLWVDDFDQIYRAFRRSTSGNLAGRSLSLNELIQ